LRQELQSINPCDYTRFTPVEGVDDLYEICLHLECDYYLKVYELGESSRLEELEADLTQKEDSIGHLINSLNAIINNINNITNITLLRDTLIAGYPNGNVSSMEQYIDSLVDTNDKETLKEIINSFLTKPEYKEDLWITLTGGLEGNELREQTKSDFTNRLRRKVLQKEGPLRRARSKLANYRGDFDQRKSLPDVIDYYECNYDDGTARGLVIVPKSWDYMKCSNPASLITLENWGEVKNKRPIKLFIYNTELTKLTAILCFNYENLMNYIEHGVKLRNWIRHNPSIPIEEGTGMKGGPGDIKITKLPNGDHILVDSLDELDGSHINYGLVPIYLEMRVGNERGIIGVSMSHGQNRVTVYGLFKVNEEGSIMNKEKVMKYRNSLEESDEGRVNPNIDEISEGGAEASTSY